MKPKILTKLRFLGALAVDQPVRIWRHSKFVVSGWIFPRYKRNAVIIPCPGGLGDNLMLTTVAREIKKRNPGALVHILTRHPRVFDRNPDVDFVSRQPSGSYPWMRPFRVTYSLGFPWNKHFIYYLCKCVNISGSIDYRTYIYPEYGDNQFAEKIIKDLGANPVVICRSGGKNNRKKKCWPSSYWNELVQVLLRSGPVLDLGEASEPLQISDPRYRSLLGQTSLHQSAALLARSKALITVESGLNHLAAAFDIPTVCILGGVIAPEAIRYPKTKVLFNRPECCDCWNIRECDRNLECLSIISVAHVIAALDEIQAWTGQKAEPKVARLNTSRTYSAHRTGSRFDNNPASLPGDS